MCKLDGYRYKIHWEGTEIRCVSIVMMSNRDPDIGDIVTELNGYGNKAFVEGYYFHTGNIEVRTRGSVTRLYISVLSHTRRDDK